MSEYRRRVTGGEKSMVAFNELRPPFVIQLVLEGHGDPEPEALFEALRRTTEANPGSSLRLEEGEEDDYWVLGPEPTFTVVDAPEFEAMSGDGAPFLSWRLDAKTGPTCELVHVRGKDHGYLIFRALHAVMDGQGTLLWVRDFMRCLRGEDPIGHPSTLDVDALCDVANQTRRPQPKHDALHPMGAAAPEPVGAYGWRRLEVDRPLPPRISGDLAVGLAQAAFANNGEPGMVRIHLPTDLRPMSKGARSTANLFGSLFIELTPEMTAEAVGLRIVQMLYQREGKRPVGLYGTHEIGSMAAHRVKAFLDLNHLHDTGRYAFSATLSHLGKLDGGSLSAGAWTTTSALFVPLVGDVCVVSVNGLDDRTEVAVGLGDRFDTAQLDALADAMRRAITKA